MADTWQIAYGGHILHLTNAQYQRLWTLIQENRRDEAHTLADEYAQAEREADERG